MPLSVPSYRYVLALFPAFCVVVFFNIIGFGNLTVNTAGTGPVFLPIQSKSVKKNNSCRDVFFEFGKDAILRHETGKPANGLALDEQQ